MPAQSLENFSGAVMPVTDSADLTATMAYGYYLLARYQCGVADSLAVGLDTHGDVRELRRFVRLLDRRLDEAVPAELCSLVPLYELIYRVGHGCAPSTKIRTASRQKCFHAWLHGDMAITETQLAGMIRTDLRRNPADVDARHLSWYAGVIDGWCRALRRTPRFAQLSFAENFARLSILLKENLCAFYPASETRVKQGWVKANLIDNLTDCDTLSLKKYRSFLSSAVSHGITASEYIARDTAALSELGSRTDIHPFEREAYRLLRNSRQFSA